MIGRTLAPMDLPEGSCPHRTRFSGFCDHGLQGTVKSLALAIAADAMQ